MKKRKKAPKASVGKKAGAVIPATGRKLPSFRFGLATLAVLVFSVIGAAATNNIYHGHVVVNQDRAKSSAIGHSELNSKATKVPVSAQSAVPNKPALDIVVKYGPAAKSPLVAAAIKKLEFIAPVAGAKRAADRSEAIAHGNWRPGANPVEAIMAGYVPPGMPPEQAAMLYRTLPHTPMAPEPMTSERFARLADPANPMDSVLQAEGLSRSRINAQNDESIRASIRERFGPIYVPPLHRDHQGSIREMLDGSGNIVSQYAYDPYGNATKLQGSMDSDFQYGGYYFHAPSGLSLTLNRAYSPVLGRFINRDPIGEEGGVNLYAYCENNPIGFHDPSGLQAYNKINNGEILNDVTQIGVVESGVGRALSKEAVADANASGLPGILHGPRNAYQHCLWSCLMAKSPYIGPVAAAAIANNHELAGRAGGQSPEDEAMDRANNKAGRQAARCDTPCKDKCKSLLNSGGLVGRGGIPVNTLYGPGF